MSFIQLGPNQIDYERKELEKEKRIARLKQVLTRRGTILTQQPK
jgi:hypothetical protein